MGLVIKDSMTLRGAKEVAKLKAASTAFGPFVDDCPVTGQRQGIAYIGGTEKGHDHLTIITRGETTAWKHTLISEEVDPAAIPSMSNEKLRHPAGKTEDARKENDQ